VVQVGNGITDALLKAVVEGKISDMTPEQKLEYLSIVSSHLGLNPVLGSVKLIKSGDGEVIYITSQGLYELASRYGVSFKVVSNEILGNGDERVVVVKALVYTADGRFTEALGTCPVVRFYPGGGKRNVGLSDAILIAETKAKTRGIRQLFGLPLGEEEAKDVAGVDGKGLEELDDVSTVKELIEVGRKLLVSYPHLKESIRLELRRKYEALHELTGEVADERFLSFIGLSQ
ncbi:MAG: hypothetical protein N3E49_09490, partial [Bacteroidia bacterium]|nr:hypothetical protein [Bacteroidia bacterium]